MRSCGASRSHRHRSSSHATARDCSPTLARALVLRRLRLRRLRYSSLSRVVGGVREDDAVTGEQRPRPERPRPDARHAFQRGSVRGGDASVVPHHDGAPRGKRRVRQRRLRVGVEERDRGMRARVPVGGPRRVPGRPQRPQRVPQAGLEVDVVRDLEPGDGAAGAGSGGDPSRAPRRRVARGFPDAPAIGGGAGVGVGATPAAFRSRPRSASRSMDACCIARWRSAATRASAGASPRTASPRTRTDRTGPGAASAEEERTGGMRTRTTSASRRTSSLRYRPAVTHRHHTSTRPWRRFAVENRPAASAAVTSWHSTTIVRVMGVSCGAE